jgi:D-alanine-D-alanine ligase
MHIPYTGSGVMASALGMDKWRTKLLWQAAGLPVPEYALADCRFDFADIEEELGLPLFVKPAHEGSSIGISKVKEAGANCAASAYAEAAKYDPLVIAEKGDSGRRIHGRHPRREVALPIIKIEPATDWYDYEAKYNRDDTRLPLPLRLPEAKEMESVSRRWKPFVFLVVAAGGGSIS